MGVLPTVMMSCVLVATTTTRKGETIYQPAVDVPLTASAVVAGVSLVAFRADWGPRQCRWCDVDAAGRLTLNPLDFGARSLLKAPDTYLPAVRRAGDVVGYGLVPALALAPHLLTWSEVGFEQAAHDALIVGEAVAIAHATEQGFKYVVARTRPAMRFNPHSRTADPDDDMSMVSGHATVGFALAVANGTLASLHGARSVYWIWISGLSLATVSSVMRVVADRHYLTDVLAGAALGSLVGFTVPWVHTKLPVLRKHSLSVSTSVGKGSGSVALSGNF
ncbi:MAG: phosphatase PAP2 family protein [Myxococcaceae bacterium]|nr:phosphatase PAP2 family protein [Myxococcaceae bacterium]